jgi:hypothetical protein
MKLLPAAMAIAATFLVPAAYADCSYPQAPTQLPDGSTATLKEMLSGQKAVQGYNEQMMAYLSCLKLERANWIAHAGTKLTKQEKQEFEAIEDQKHNAAVDQLKAVADKFNTQVRVFKAKGKKAD